MLWAKHNKDGNNIVFVARFGEFLSFIECLANFLCRDVKGCLLYLHCFTWQVTFDTELLNRTVISCEFIHHTVKTWSSLVEEDEGSYLPNCQTNLVFALCTLSLLFCKFINATAFQLGRCKPSSPVSCRGYFLSQRSLGSTRKGMKFGGNMACN